jgi:phosphoglucomutase
LFSPFSTFIYFDFLVTGVYTRRIFVNELGAPADALINAYPAPDFNGHHPDPNLSYAKDLVDKVYTVCNKLFS